MRAFIVITALVTSLAFTSAIAQTASTSAPVTRTKYSTAETEIGTLLDNPAARAVVDKHIPGFSSGDQINMVRSMTLKGLQQFSPDKVTDQVLAEIDADLAKLRETK